MSILVRTALFTTIISGTFWTLSMAMKGGTGGLEVLALFLVIFALQAVGFVIGVWAYRAQPEMRSTARWLLGLPFVFYFLPDLIMAMAGGRLSGAALAAIVLFVLAVILGACVFIPRKVASALPVFLFRSTFINMVILLLLLLGWLFAVGVLVWLFGIEGEATSRALSRDATGYGRGASIVIGAIYLLGLGGASLLVAAWAWLGLRSGIDGACRKLNTGQMLVATPGLLIGLAALYLMFSQG